MRTPLTISAIGHAGFLLWGLISFAVKPFDAAPAESMPVDIMTAAEFSEMLAGTKTALKTETPKPLVEKVADAKPAEDQTRKVVDKNPEVAAAAEPPPVPVQETPPEPKPKDAQKKPDPKPDPKEALKKDEARKPEPKKETKVATPMPPKKPVTQQPKFDATRIAALLDKRDPQRHAAVGDTLNHTPTLGTNTGNAPRLSQNEIDALRARIQACWTVPAGAAEAKDLIVQVRILFRQDGSLQAEPMLINRGSSPYFQVAAEAALRAVRRCAPYSFLPVAKYEAWKDVEVTFDPRDMYRG